MNKLKESVVQEVGSDGLDHYLVRARLALLQHQWKVVLVQALMCPENGSSPIQCAGSH